MLMIKKHKVWLRTNAVPAGDENGVVSTRVDIIQAERGAELGHGVAVVVKQLGLRGEKWWGCGGSVNGDGFAVWRRDIDVYTSTAPCIVGGRNLFKPCPRRLVSVTQLVVGRCDEQHLPDCSCGIKTRASCRQHPAGCPSKRTFGMVIGRCLASWIHRCILCGNTFLS